MRASLARCQCLASRVAWKHQPTHLIGLEPEILDHLKQIMQVVRWNGDEQFAAGEAVEATSTALAEREHGVARMPRRREERRARRGSQLTVWQGALAHTCRAGDLHGALHVCDHAEQVERHIVGQVTQRCSGDGAEHPKWQCVALLLVALGCDGCEETLCHREVFAIADQAACFLVREKTQVILPHVAVVMRRVHVDPPPLLSVVEQAAYRDICRLVAGWRVAIAVGNGDWFALYPELVLQRVVEAGTVNYYLCCQSTPTRKRIRAVHVPQDTTAGYNKDTLALTVP